MSRSWFRRLFGHTGRLPHLEFCSVLLAHALISELCLGADALVHLGDTFSSVVFVPWYTLVYQSVATIPLTSVTVRRLHDTGRTEEWAWAWMVLRVQMLYLLRFCWDSGEAAPVVAFTAVIWAGVFLAVLMLGSIPGSREANRFGLPVAAAAEGSGR